MRRCYASTQKYCSSVATGMMYSLYWASLPLCHFMQNLIQRHRACVAVVEAVVNLLLTRP